MQHGDGLFRLLRGSEGSKRANRDNGKDRHGEMIAEFRFHIPKSRTRIQERK